MADVKYIEPHFLSIGKEIYDKYAKLRNNGKVKGNFVSLIEGAIKHLRQRGPRGLMLWAKCDQSREFIYEIIKDKDFFNDESNDFDEAWNSIELGIKVLIYAKYVARTSGS